MIERGEDAYSFRVGARIGLKGKELAVTSRKVGIIQTKTYDDKLIPSFACREKRIGDKLGALV